MIRVLALIALALSACTDSPPVRAQLDAYQDCWAKHTRLEPVDDYQILDAPGGFWIGGQEQRGAVLNTKPPSVVVTPVWDAWTAREEAYDLMQRGRDPSLSDDTLDRLIARRRECGSL